MRAVDRWLQSWRIAKVLPWIRPGDRLLDVGCYDRVLLRRVSQRIALGVGVDPLTEPGRSGNLRWVRGVFPGDVGFEPGGFDCVTALAVLEHLADPAAFAAACAEVLAPGGRVALTVPHPRVDGILDALIRLGLADGMSEEEHHGFDVAETIPVFEGAGFRLRHRAGFQLGLNTLFVFERPDADSTCAPVERGAAHGAA